jgi:hypothetical protein
MQQKKGRAANSIYDRIACVLSRCPAIQSFLFQLRDRFNILLRGMWGRFLRRPLGHKVLKQLGQQARLYTVLALLSFQPDLNDGTNVSVGHLSLAQHLVDLS